MNETITPGRKYRASELSEMADDLLRADARSELCRACGARGIETGEVISLQQGSVDAEGNLLILSFPEYECEDGHRWFKGEGAVRGIGGDNPILFEEHFQSRRRREIYNSLGSPDPSIQSGMYYRAHPQGRKINSLKARQEQGASYFKS